MPDNISLILEGMRQAGAGFQAAGQGIAAGREQSDQRAEVKRRADSEQLRKERLGELSTQVDTLTEAAKSDDFDQRAFVEASKPIIKGSLELGEPGILRSLDPVQEIINQRQKDAESKAKTTSDTKKEGREAAKTSKEEQDRLFQRTRTLQQDYTKESLDTKKVSQAFSDIENLTDSPDASPTDQMAAMYGFIRGIDPSTGVKEGETATVASARGIPETIVNAWNQVVNGSVLTPRQMGEVKNTMETLYRSRLKNQVSVDDQFDRRAKKNGVDSTDVITTPAKSVLEGLDKKKTAREAKAKKDAEAPINAATDGAPPMKVLGKKAGDALFEANKAAFSPLVQQTNADRAASGQPPMTQSEINAKIVEHMNKAGFTVDPRLP